MSTVPICRLYDVLIVSNGACPVLYAIAFAALQRFSLYLLMVTGKSFTIFTMAEKKKNSPKKE